MKIITWLKQTRCTHPLYTITKIKGEYYNTCKACGKLKEGKV